MATIIFKFKDGAAIESDFHDEYTNELLDEILKLHEGVEIIKIKLPDGTLQSYTIDCGEYASAYIQY